MQRIVIRKIQMKDGVTVPAGASVSATTNPNKQQNVLIVFKGKVYNVNYARFFEEVEENESGKYCKFCRSHNVEHEYHKLDKSLQLIIACRDCGRVYEAYNEAV